MLRRQLAFTLYIYLNLIALFCVAAHIEKFSDARIRTQPIYVISSMADFLKLNDVRKGIAEFPKRCRSTDIMEYAKFIFIFVSIKYFNQKASQDTITHF